MAPRLITLKELATALSCTLSAVHRWRHEGRFSAVKIGRLVRVTKEEADRLAKEGLRPIAAKHKAASRIKARRGQ
jgi:excisionase family DNA binding protein